MHYTYRGHGWWIDRRAYEIAQYRRHDSTFSNRPCRKRSVKRIKKKEIQNQSLVRKINLQHWQSSWQWKSLKTRACLNGKRNNGRVRPIVRHRYSGHYFAVFPSSGKTEEVAAKMALVRGICRFSKFHGNLKRYGDDYAEATCLETGKQYFLKTKKSWAVDNITKRHSYEIKYRNTN